MKRPTLKITTLLVLSALYLIIVSFSVFSGGLSKVVDRWGDGFEMTVYLKDSVAPSELQEVEAKLKSFENQVSYEFVGKEKALDKFKNDMGNLSVNLTKDPEIIGVFSDQYKVNLKNILELKAQQNLFDQITNALDKLNAIDEISYGKEWLQKYTKVISSVNGLSVGLYLALIVTMLFVIGNIIRTEVYSRKNEIEILELVGATKWEIRKPFYREAILVSSIAMSIAIAAISILIYFIRLSASDIIQITGLSNLIDYLSWIQIVSLFLLSVGIGFLGTWLCVNRLNDGWSVNQTVS